MTMRNPNRTTKPERRHIRRYNRYAVRVLGVAEAARWHRDGILLDEAKGFENLVVAVLYGPVPDDLNDRVTAALDAQRDALERKLGVGPGILTATSSNVNYHDMRQLEPGEWQATVDATRRAPAVVTIPESLGGGTFEVPHRFTVPHRNGARQADATFGALYQAYREGRDAGDEYLEWDGDPWRDPNEVAAVHAEAIENALNEDIEPGE